MLISIFYLIVKFKLWDNSLLKPNYALYLKYLPIERIKRIQRIKTLLIMLILHLKRAKRIRLQYVHQVMMWIKTWTLMWMRTGLVLSGNILSLHPSLINSSLSINPITYRLLMESRRSYKLVGNSSRTMDGVL